MGILNWFKKIFQEQEVERKIQIKFDDLESWIENKKIALREQDEIFIKEIKKIIRKLCEEFDNEIEVLELVDLNDKKEDEKAKLIIMENLNNYINYLKKLRDELKVLETTIWISSDGLIKKINLLFSNFEKKSSVSFQKATFLIGRELERVRESIGNFCRDFQKSIDENKELIENSKIIMFVDDKLKKIKNIEKIKKELENKINNFDNSIKELNNKIKNLNEEIEKIKKSKEYLLEIEKKEKIERDKQELEKEIYKLKELIDFKGLANIFHANEKEMQLIKEYRDNFKNKFEKDSESILELINSLRESKMDRKLIAEKSDEIIKKKKQIEDFELTDFKNCADILVKKSEIQRIEKEINELEKQKDKERVRIKKTEDNKRDIIELIKKKISDSIELVY